MTMGLCLEEKCRIQLLGSWIQIMVETLIIAGRLQGMYLLLQEHLYAGGRYNNLL